jgi:hypothetical protein
MVVAELIIAIENGGGPEELYQKLTELPPEHEELYEWIIWKIPPEEQHHTFNYLQLSVHRSKWISPCRNRYFTRSPPSNLLAMTLAIEPSTQAQESPKLIMSQADKIERCTKTWWCLPRRCRGFIYHPFISVRWSSADVLENFCKGDVSVHKTVADSLFVTRTVKVCGIASIQIYWKIICMHRKRDFSSAF